MVRIPLVVLFGCSLLAGPAGAQTGDAAPEPDGIAAIVSRLEAHLLTGDPGTYLTLLAESADREEAQAFASMAFMPDATRAVVRERDRRPAEEPPGAGYQVLLEVFLEADRRARIGTWRLDVAKDAGTGAWGVTGQEILNSIDGLHRLALDQEKQFRASNLTIEAEDLQLTLEEGLLYQAEIPGGITAVLLQGRGEMRFRPTPVTEQGQVRIFSESETLVTRFDSAFVRLNPADFAHHISARALTAEPVDARALRRAEEVFQAEVTKSFSVDLSRVSPHAWSLVPPIGDFLAEIRTRRFGSLTYAKSASEAEDITLFDRARQRNIALYASADKLATRGRFYDEDDLREYDILDYEIDAHFEPDRQWMEGRARLLVRVKSHAMSTLTLRLAEKLTVSSVTADLFGPVLHFRIRNQNAVVLNFPATIVRESQVQLVVEYSGEMRPQGLDREALMLGDGQSVPQFPDLPVPALEPSFMYSNRAYWYPQSPVTDYATATLRITVPSGYQCVASGDPEEGSPTPVPGQPERTTYAFSATQPLRYLACLISRFVPVVSQVIQLEEEVRMARAGPASPGLDGVPGGGQPDASPPERAVQGVSYQSVGFTLLANARVQDRARTAAERAPEIVKFYTSLIGDYPYPALGLALVENDLPGGHSPAYFAAVHHPSPFQPLVWRNDPAAFTNYPEFFLAHEVAHQWWGQAVGWKNYHEQWLSEGFAQYFAALYAREYRGEEVFRGILGRLRRFATTYSDQGPVHLGYRLGHIRGQGRIFRALVYNKGAAVLHMLRRFVGDEAFFRGVRRFYATWRFRKAGTEDLRQAIEAESNLNLERFFERWIYGASLPTIRFSYATTAGKAGTEAAPEAILRFQQSGDVFDVPVTVTLQYADGRSQHVVVRIADAATERRVRLEGALRRVEVNGDEAALGTFLR